MAQFRFITNLRPRTVSSFENSGHRPQAWLLSTHRLENETQELAHAQREAGLDLFADNGTKRLIDVAINRFKTPLKPLQEEIWALRTSLGPGRRIPWPREVPDELRRRTAAAAREVENSVERDLAGESAIDVLNEQLRMRPTHIIAKEDFTGACLLGLGLEREITGWRVGFFDALNRRTLDYWDAVSNDPRCRDLKVYATLSALDYATARSAAELAATAGVTYVALGFAGINLDRDFTEVFWLPHRRELPKNAPRRYARTTEIILGIRDGYRRAGVRLKAFHALGMGARAQYPILAAALDWYTDISVDSTSPLQDAVNDLVFYDETNRGDRVTVIEAAERVLNGGTWSFASPFCQYLKQRFGHDPDAARDWWQSVGNREIERDDLHPNATLGQALGVFASDRAGMTAVQTRGRVGHNHWVCDQLTQAVPSSKRRKWGMGEIDTLVDTRTSHTQRGVIAAQHILRLNAES